MLVNHYRFSISWSRVLPDGDRSSLNKYGISYYNDVIDKLKANGITPMVTMHHDDLPQDLQKLGGFANPLIVEYFEEYADVLYSHFGDRVKTWITFNDPYDFCVMGYGSAYLPPMVNSSGIGEYLCMHHIIKAHALAYRLYKENYASEQKGKIGITLSSGFFYSKNNNTDLEDRAQQFRIGWAANPLFSSTGEYPMVMVEDIANNSLREGRKRSRLPNFEEHWKEIVKGASDFLGLNYYTSRYVEWADPLLGVNPSLERDSKLKYDVDPKWIKAKSAILYSVPEGLGDILRWIKTNYNNVEVIVTENGWSDDGQLNDDGRIAYLKAHLSSLLSAIKSGCNVSGYTAWSVIDNFEWESGYTEKFGLYAVNLSSPHKERTAKKSAAVNFYRFSISWSRILPKGDLSSVNQHGINYYNYMINKLIQNNIIPVVTMYHFDLPDEIQKIGGFANPLFVKYFEAYADVLFANFGDRIKLWITINEPYNFCVPGYGKDFFPPLANASGIGEYLCIDHTIKAHASAYRLYKSKYFKKQKGKIGITLSSRYFYSTTNNTEMEDRAIQFMLGWVANPIFSKEGGYPDIMVKEIEKNSLKEGRRWSRLPVLDGKWKEFIKGTSDFLGLNYYTARLVDWASTSSSAVDPSIDYDSKLELSVDEKWKQAKSSWLYYVPKGLGDILRWVRDNYNNVEVIITENGWSDDGQLNDDGRVLYLKNHLRELSKAIKDGCNITGYTFWSLIDNFEWRQGYTEKFGLYSVKLESPNKARIAKKSAKVYKTIIETHKITDL